jgi:hypothetical protein
MEVERILLALQAGDLIRTQVESAIQCERTERIQQGVEFRAHLDNIRDAGDRNATAIALMHDSMRAMTSTVSRTSEDSKRQFDAIMLGLAKLNANHQTDRTKNV